MSTNCAQVEVIPFWPYIIQETGWITGLELLYEYQNPVNFFARGIFATETFTEAKFASNVLVFHVDFRQ